MLGSKRGCPAKLECLLNLSHKTAWVWGPKLRDLMKASTEPLTGRIVVGGEDEGSHCRRSLKGN